MHLPRMSIALGLAISWPSSVTRMSAILVYLEMVLHMQSTALDEDSVLALPLVGCVET